MSVPVTLTWQSVPEGFCYQNAQQFVTLLQSLLSGTVPDSAVVEIGANPPANTNAVWVRTSGGYLEGIYTYYGGWYRPHPAPALGPERRLFIGTEDGSAGTGVWAYDGGDGSNPTTDPATSVTGAMWEVDHDFDFRIPMGPGTSGSTYDGNPATVLSPPAIGSVLGAERVTLALIETTRHRHLLPSFVRTDLSGPPVAGGANDFPSDNNTHTYYECGTGTGGTDPGTTYSHQNLPPVRAAYVIKRTARQYIEAT